MLTYEFRISYSEPVLILSYGNRKTFLVYDSLNDKIIVQNSNFIKEHKYRILELKKQIIDENGKYEPLIERIMNKIEEY